MPRYGTRTRNTSLINSQTANSLYCSESRRSVEGSCHRTFRTLWHGYTSGRRTRGSEVKRHRHHRLHLITDGNRVDSLAHSPVLIVSRVRATSEINASTPRRHDRADIQRGI